MNCTKHRLEEKMNYLIGVLGTIVLWFICVIFAKLIDISNEKQEWYQKLKEGDK